MGSLLIKLTKSWISCDHLRNWSLNTTNSRVIIPPCVLQYDQLNIISFFLNIISTCIMYFTNLQYTQGVIIYSKVKLSGNPPSCQHECRESQTFLPGNTPIADAIENNMCVHFTDLYKLCHNLVWNRGGLGKIRWSMYLEIEACKIFKIPCLVLTRLTMDQLHMLNTISCAC